MALVQDRAVAVDQAAALGAVVGLVVVLAREAMKMTKALKDIALQDSQSKNAMLYLGLNLVVLQQYLRKGMPVKRIYK